MAARGDRCHTAVLAATLCRPHRRGLSPRPQVLRRSFAGIVGWWVAEGGGGLWMLFLSPAMPSLQRSTWLTHVIKICVSTGELLAAVVFTVECLTKAFWLLTPLTAVPWMHITRDFCTTVAPRRYYKKIPLLPLPPYTHLTAPLFTVLTLHRSTTTISCKRKTIKFQVSAHCSLFFVPLYLNVRKRWEISEHWNPDILALTSFLSRLQVTGMTPRVTLHFQWITLLI